VSALWADKRPMSFVNSLTDSGHVFIVGRCYAMTRPLLGTSLS
jgi:hypothetical protein